MKLFWPLYLTCLIGGTAFIYAYSPLARERVGTFLNTYNPQHISDHLDEPSATLSANKPAVAQPPPATATEQPMSLSGVSVALGNTPPTWGVVQSHAAYYTPEGTRVGQITGGTFFTYVAACAGSKGPMVECRFLSNAPTNEVFLVSKRATRLFTGSPDLLSADQLESLQQYYTLNGQIGARKLDLLQAMADKNPHTAAASAAYKAYTEHLNKAQALAKERDQAIRNGQSPLPFDDELHQLKMQELPLKTAYENAQQQFRAWKEEHADELSKPDDDAEIQRWQVRLTELRNRVPGLAL